MVKPSRPIDVAVPRLTLWCGAHRISTTVDGRALWFESFDLPLAAVSEAFGAALLVPALHAGRPLRLAGPVCETWGANLARLTDAYRDLWYPEAPRPLVVPAARRGAGEKPAVIFSAGDHTAPRWEATSRGADFNAATPAASATALCFSGGVDAFHSLLAGGHRVDTLVSVVGYDMSLRDRSRAAALRSLVRDVAAATGSRGIVLGTNLRRHPLMKATPWLRAFSGPLAAVGHLLGPTARRMLISSDGLGFEHPEVGARPSTDPLHGSASLAVEHVAFHVTRLEKIRAIAGERIVQQHLRVCWQNLHGRLNCGVCEKCVRTMLALDTCGLLDRYAGFDHGRGLVAAIDAMPRVDGVVKTFYEELLDSGLSAAARAAVRSLVARSPHSREQPGTSRPPRDGEDGPVFGVAVHGHVPRASTRLGAACMVSSRRHRLLPPAAFAAVCEPFVGRRVGYVRPEGNVGDRLIETAMIQLFAEYGIRWRLVSPSAAGDTDDLDLLAFGGGGNMGMRYLGNHAIRGAALATGLPVVILPQSFTTAEDRPYAAVYVRERGSLALRPDGILAPDLALGLATAEPARPDRDLGVYLRRDQERGGRKPFFVRDPVRLFQDPFAYLAFAARHRRIVTDRLHFAVAGLHAGREVTLVANDYHKNRSMHETWLAELGCRFAATAAETLGRRAA